MSLKEHEYIRQTLERYTNSKLEDFCDYVLITNFRQYVKRFKEKTKGRSSKRKGLSGESQRCVWSFNQNAECANRRLT